MTIGSTVRDEAKALWSGGKGPAFIAVATAWGLLLGVRMIYPIILPYIQTTFDLSLTVAGLLITILWLGGALGQLPSGILADKYSERLLMAAGTFIVAAALVLIATAPSAVVLFAATALWGVGYSLYPIARITFLANVYTDRLGSALGVTMAIGDIGQTVLPPVAAVLTVAIAWQVGLGFVAPLLIVAGILIILTGPRQRTAEQPATPPSFQNLWDILGMLRHRALGFMTVIMFLYLFIWQSFTAFYPTYLITVKGLSPSTTSIIFGFFFAVGVVVKPTAGAAYDRIGMRGSLASVLAPPVVGFALLPFVDNLWLLVAITAFISTMLGSGAVTQSYLAEAFSEEMRGTGLGVIRTVTATFAAGGPVVFGAVADAGYFDEGYLILAVIMAIVIFLIFRIPKS